MDKEKEKWLKEMKKHFEEEERQKDIVPEHTEEALERLTPEVWNAIVSGKINLERGVPEKELLKKHGEMRPVFDFLAGQKVHEQMSKEDVHRIMRTKEAEDKARLLVGLMEAVEEKKGLGEEHPAQAASYIRSSLAQQHKERGTFGKIKDFIDDVVDFVGNALASMLGF